MKTWFLCSGQRTSEETSRMGRMGRCSVLEAIEEAVMCCAQTDHITACFDRLPAYEMKPVHERQPAHEGKLLLEASYITKVRREFHDGQLQELLVHNRTFYQNFPV